MAYVNWQIAEHRDTCAVGVGFQCLPLSKKNKLLPLNEAD
jgi:hypothetical protein